MSHDLNDVAFIIKKAISWKGDNKKDTIKYLCLLYDIEYDVLEKIFDDVLSSFHPEREDELEEEISEIEGEIEELEEEISTKQRVIRKLQKELSDCRSESRYSLGQKAQISININF